MPYRIAVWGPGHVGRSVIRAAKAHPDFEVVIVKARRDPDRPDFGVPVTTSKDEVLALDLDCVVVTPAAAAIFKGLDDDVIALLKSGKSVVSTAAYHNPWMPNWASSGRADCRASHGRMPSW